MSPLSVTDQLKAGMLTDVIAPGTLQRMQDCYLRRDGEVVTRGPILDSSVSSVFASGISGGVSQVAFHPDFGSLMNSVYSNNGGNASDIEDTAGYSDGYRFCGAPLQGSATLSQANPALAWTGFNEGSYENGVYVAATGSTTYTTERCLSNAVLNREIIMAGENGRLFRWGGSTTASYNTGTISRTANSRTVTGAGGANWSGLEAGMYLMVDGVASAGATAQNAAMLITKVVDSTTLEVEYPYVTSGTGESYRIVPMALVQSPDGVWNETDEFPRTIGVCANHQGRLFVAGPSDSEHVENTIYNFNRIRWSGNQTEINSTYSHHRGVNLWHSQGYIDVFPGLGGTIRGLVSMGNELIIIKSNAIFRLLGTVAYDGSEASPVSLQVISHNIGAQGTNAWTMTKAGLVVAHRSGLYLYNGEGLQNITAGRVGNWWAHNFRHSRFNVNSYSDKVIVGAVDASATSNTEHLVWMIDKDYFWVMTYPLRDPSVGFTTFSANDEWVGDYLYAAYPFNTDITVDNTVIHHATHKSNNKVVGDNTIDNISSATTPETYIQTAPSPLGVSDSPNREGRVKNAYVHMYVESTTNAQAKLYLGTTIDQLDATEDANVEDDLDGGDTAEYIPDSGDLDRDRIWRVPQHAGEHQAPAASIEVYGPVNCFLRFYRAFIEYEVSLNNPSSSQETY